ncbi:unnamed protein product [Closterium sp. NIES-53]
MATPRVLRFDAEVASSLRSEETHFTQVRTASEFLTAIKARYATPTTVSLGRLFLPFLFPDLTSFERTADLITHLRLLDSSYRTACTDAQLALLPPPMAITIYFIATSLPDRLASVRDVLLLKHPSELTIKVLESALKDVKRNLRSVASASGVVPPPLFHGCTIPQLPTFSASLASAASDVTAAAVTTSSRSWGRSGRRGGHGAGGGGAGGGGDVASSGDGSAGARGAPHAAADDSPAAASGCDARVRQPPTGLPAAGVGAAAWSFSGGRFAFFHSGLRSFPLFLQNRTTLTPHPTLVSVALADPTSGPVTARYTTTLPCPALPSGSLTGFHVPSFLRNLVGVRPLVSQHVGVWIEPSGETAVCVDGDTAAAAEAAAAAAAAATAVTATATAAAAATVASATAPNPCHGPSSGSRVSPGFRFSLGSCVWSGLPRVLPTLPPSLAPPCGPCVEGRLRATPHSSSLRLATEPFETLHLDKSDVTSTLIRWLLTTADTCGRCVSCLHSDRGGEFRSGILVGFFREQGIRQSWTLPESPQQNGVAERRIGLVMEIARTSMNHARAPHFLWPYGVWYPGVASRFRVWGCLALVRDTSTDKILPRAFFDSRDVLFDESVPYYVRCVPRYPSPLGSPSVGAESVPVRGPESGGAGVGAEPVTAGDSSLREAGVSAASRGVLRLGVHLLQDLESLGLTLLLLVQPPPPPVSGLRTLRLPSPSPPSPPSPPVSGPPLPPLDPSPAVFPPPLPPLSPPLSHTWPSRRSPCARPSSPIPFTDLRTALFCSTPPRSSPSVLPSPPKSALSDSLSTPVTNYYRTYRSVLSRVLASLVTDPRASLSSVSTLTAAVTEFASTRCLDYATCLVAAPPTSPLAVGGESALGCDALEERQFELEFLAAASSHLCAMLLAPEGDPDALDIPTPRTYAEAVSGPWASQWRAAMDSAMASYRFTGTYVDEVTPPWANVVDGMVKRPPGSPSVFKAHYVARGFSQREGVDFFQTFAPTPKMTTLRVLLHVAAQRDYELHSLDFSTAFLQGILHEEPSSADLSMFVRRGSTPFFVLVYVDDLVFATADRVSLADVKLELQKRHTCTDLGELRHYLGLQITRDRAARTITLSHSHMVQQVLQRACGLPHVPDELYSPGPRLPSSVSTSIAEAEIYAGAMAAQELRWLTFLLTDLSERPSSAPTLFTDNKASILLG